MKNAKSLRRTLAAVVLFLGASLAVAQDIARHSGRSWTIETSVATRYFVNHPSGTHPPGWVSEPLPTDEPVVVAPGGKHFFFVSFHGDPGEDRLIYELRVFAVDAVREALRQGRAAPAPLRTVVFRSAGSDETDGAGIYASRWASPGEIVFIGVQDKDPRRVWRLDVGTGELRPLTSGSFNVSGAGYSYAGGSVTFIVAHWTPWAPLDEYPMASIRDGQLGQLAYGPRKVEWHSYASWLGAEPRRFAVRAPGTTMDGPWISPDGRWAIAVYVPKGESAPDHWRRYEFVPRQGLRFVLIDMKTGAARNVLDAPSGTVTQAGRGITPPFRAIWSGDSRHVLLFNSAVPLTDAAVDDRKKMSYVLDLAPDSGEWSIVAPIQNAHGQKMQDVRWDSDRVLARYGTASGQAPAWRAFTRTKSAWVEQPAGAPAQGRVASATLPGLLQVRLVQGPNDPPRIEASEGERRLVLTEPDPVLQGIHRTPVETMTWKAPDGVTRDAFLLQPRRRTGNEPLPLVIQAIDGALDTKGFRPDGALSTGFAAQAMAAKGFAVLQVPFFYRDDPTVLTPQEGPTRVGWIDAAVDALAERLPIDRARIGLVGFSRSGFLTYYIATHPGRVQLAAAVVHDGLTASYGEYVNAAAIGDERSVYEQQYGGGTFWANKSAWMDAPAFNLDRLRAPMLFSVTGQGISNAWAAMETVGAFRYMRHPFDVLYFPEGSHTLQRPREREAAMRSTVDWMSFWLNNDLEDRPGLGDRNERWRQMRREWEERRKAQGAPAAAAPTSSSVAEGSQRLMLTDEDARTWKWVTSPQLTPDGAWLVYVAAPGWGVREGGDTTVIVRETGSEVERRYPSGDSRRGGGRLVLSRSGKWAAFSRVTGAAGGGAESLSVVLVEVGTDKQREFPGARDFEFTSDSSERLLFRERASADASVFRIVLADPRTGDRSDIEGARSAVLDPLGTSLAWTDASGLFVCDLPCTNRRRLDASGQSYAGISWSPDGTALATLRGSGEETALIAVTHVDSSPKKTEWLPGHAAAFPRGHQIQPTFRWHSDNRGLFFSIRAPAVAPTVADAVPNLSLWHSRDDRLPAGRKSAAARPVPQWCYLVLSERRFVRITDDSVQNVELPEKGRFALAYDLKAYGWQNEYGPSNNARAQRRDYFLVDIDTGRRTPLVSGLNTLGQMLSAVPQLSPDGQHVLYQDNDGNYVVWDISRGRLRNLTSGLPAKFYFPENDPKTVRQLNDGNGQGLPILQGWSTDGSRVLLSDGYDVWSLSLRGGEPVNLTGDGRRRNVWYRRAVLTESVQMQRQGSRSPVDLKAPIYFNVFHLDSAHRELARWTPGRTGVEILHDDEAETHFLKAADSDVILMTRMTAIESEDHFRVAPSWKAGSRLTDINPQQRNFAWSPGARLLSYTTASGARRHAILRLPVGYVPGRRYPTVVNIYKGLSPGIHFYHPPNADFIDTWLRRGYAALQPDIMPRLDDAGAAALEDVMAGVDAAVATGVVDGDRLGLYGHSYGAYETLFIVSRTDRFKVAAPSAGATNLWSHCGAVYIDYIPMSAICEAGQPFLSGPWWRSWDAYLRNSPLYHAKNIHTPLLLAHGDRDVNIPFGQSLELFNSLRALGRPIVLLQYSGEGHQLSEPAQQDADNRQLALFDHFLRGAPAPEWWSRGLALYEGQIPRATMPQLD